MSPSIKPLAEVAINQSIGKSRHLIKPLIKLPLIGIKPINQTLWQKSPSLNQYEVYSSIRPTWTVMPLSSSIFCIVVCLFFFLKSLTFAWIALSGFQSTGNIFFVSPNFCLDRPFRFSIHQDAHFWLKPPFRVFDLASFFFLFFFLSLWQRTSQSLWSYLSCRV